MIRRWALLAALFLIPCGAIGVVETTEARYAEIAREMVASGDYLTPHLNGLPHFDKPPGAYWAIAPGVALLGHNEWGARVPVVLAAFLTLFFAARIAASVGADAELTTWILASGPLFFILFHLASADPFLTAAIAGFHAAFLSKRRLLPFVALGIGFLIKGPVVFVPTLLPLLAAAWWTRSWSALRPLRSLTGWLIALVLGLTWYVFLVVSRPGVASFLLDSELWQRFASTKHHRGGPPYYFVVLLVIGALPWTWATIRGLVARIRARADFQKTVIAAWVLVPLVFFSFSGSKLPGYVLPLTPALAISAAWWLAGARWPPRTAPVLLALFAVVPWFFASQDEKAGSVRPVARYLMEHRQKGDWVPYECGPFNAGLPYYLGERVQLIDVQRDVQFLTPEEQIWVPAAGLSTWTASPNRLWIFGDEDLSRKHLETLLLQGTKVEVVYRWRKCVLLLVHVMT